MSFQRVHCVSFEITRPDFLEQIGRVRGWGNIARGDIPGDVDVFLCRIGLCG